MIATFMERYTTRAGLEERLAAGVPEGVRAQRRRTPVHTPSRAARWRSRGVTAVAHGRGRIEPMPERLYFTNSDEANELIAKDPMALLIGFALDQQVTVPKAFIGPLVIKERVGTLDPRKLAKIDLDPSSARNRRSTASQGKWPNGSTHSPSPSATTTAATPSASGRTQERRRSSARPRRPARLRRDEDQVARAVLAKRYKLGKAKSLVPPHPTLGDVDSAAGAARLPGREAPAQGGVVEDEGLTIATAWPPS